MNNEVLELSFTLASLHRKPEDLWVKYTMLKPQHTTSIAWNNSNNAQNNSKQCTT